MGQYWTWLSQANRTMIDTITVLDKLGNSDHNMLEWKVDLNPASSLFNRPTRNYASANFTAIRQALKQTGLRYYRVMLMTCGKLFTVPCDI